MRTARRLVASLALALAIAFVGGRGSPAEAAPDDGRAPARATGPDAAVGFWGGPIGSKLDEGTLDAFRLDVLPSAGGYEATTRADVTLTSKGSPRKVVVTTIYTGRAQDDVLLFQSTERRRSIDGGPGELLVPASLRVTPKGGHVEARVGNDAEGYTDFTLVPRNGVGAPRTGAAEAPRAPSPLLALVGSWGGNMSKADLGSGVLLDEMFIDVSAEGTGVASVRMNLTLKKDGSDIPLVILARYEHGRADGDAMRWDKVPWHRTVTPTGQKTDLDGNPLVLRVKPDGGMSGKFEGGDGFTFTLAKRVASAAPRAPLAALVGSWGGDMSKADLGSGVHLDEMFIDVSAEGTGVASVRMNLTLKKDGKDIPLVILARYEHGRVDGDAMRWDKVPWHRTVTPTGQKTDLDGNPLVLRLKPDGGMSGKFEGGDGFTFTLARRSAAPAR